MGYTDLFSFNGSNVDFSSLVNMADWFLKQQAMKMLPWDLKLRLELLQKIDNMFEGHKEKLMQLKLKADSLYQPQETPGEQKGGGLGDKLKAIGGGIKNLAGSNGGMIGGALSGIAGMIGKRGIDGKYGGITKGIDAAYDTVQNVAGKIPGVGLIVSMAMGAGKLLGNAVSKIGGGTDGMTKTDAIMNSAFLNLTPLGLINGFGGAKANTYTRNQELDKSTNGGFQGFLSTQDVTGIGAGKKYGLFSRGAMNKQNQLTEFTTNMKHTISGIVDTNTINNLAALGSTPFLAQQLSMDLNGGIQLMLAARQGMRFTRRVVHKYSFGSWIKNLFKSNDPKSKESMDVRLGNNLDLSLYQQSYGLKNNREAEKHYKDNVVKVNLKVVSNDDDRVKTMQARYGINQNQKPVNGITGQQSNNTLQLETNKISDLELPVKIESVIPDDVKQDINNLLNKTWEDFLKNNITQPVSLEQTNKSIVELDNFMTPQSTNNTLSDLITTNTNSELLTLNKTETIQQPSTIQLNRTLPSLKQNNMFTGLSTPLLKLNFTTPSSFNFSLSNYDKKSKTGGFFQTGGLLVDKVLQKYQQGNKLKRTFKTVDVATGKYVEIPKDLNQDQIKGRIPIRLTNGTAVFMNGDGTVTSDRWETVGEREHLTPKGLEGLKLPNWILYNKDKDEYSSNFDNTSSKDDIKLFKNFVKDNLKGYDIWQNEVEQGKYYALPKKEADKRNWKTVEKILNNFGSDSEFEDDDLLESNENNDDYVYPNWGEAARKIIEWNNNVSSKYFKQGGQMNVIPEGALHARLNHMKDVDSDLAKLITHKGIPVITVEKDGEVVQHAEIEHSEIIFTLDVTNKIEDLRKKWHLEEKDEYAIEAGKLLVKEILHNTDDRTNLIASVE